MIRHRNESFFDDLELFGKCFRWFLQLFVRLRTVSEFRACKSEIYRSFCRFCLLNDTLISNFRSARVLIKCAMNYSSFLF